MAKSDDSPSPPADMKTFLTQQERNGELWAGPRIVAPTWENAEQLASWMGVEVIGVLLAEGDIDLLPPEEETGDD